MAFLAKLNILAFVLILLSYYGSRCNSASLLHRQSEIRNSRCFSHCRSGNRKLDILNCEIAGDLKGEQGQTAWSQSLKAAKKSPPPPKHGKSPMVGVPPPPGGNT
nr:PREDICTED: uncharacterized protein LOC108202400 [Daucus carota subsp. sativus]